LQTIYLAVDEDVAKLKDPGLLLHELGIQPWQPDYYPEIASLSENSAAAQAGLIAGDQIKRLDSIEISNVQNFVNEIQKRPRQKVDLVIVRDGRELRRPLKIAEKLINGLNTGIIGAVLRVPKDSIDSILVRQRYGPLESLAKACKSTYEMSALSLKMFREMLKGKVSIKNLSGPISIAQQASYSVQSGLDQFVKFLALISIALGIVNLLPVPMLDGGQIVFNVMELVKGSPVSEQTELVFQQLGIVCIFLIMGLAIFNDIERILF
jgi:regulator of sigma E protease